MCITRSKLYRQARRHHCNVRLHVCVRVCHNVSQTRCGRITSRTAFVIGSFEGSFPLILTYLLSAVVIPMTNISCCHVYSLHSVGYTIGSSSMASHHERGRPATSKLAPDLTPSIPIGCRKHEKHEQIVFPTLQTITLCSSIRK